jgi:hypothetical protein
LNIAFVVPVFSYLSLCERRSASDLDVGTLDDADPYFKKMAGHDIPERYGIRPVRIVKSSHVQIAGRPPLTERQIREN